MITNQEIIDSIQEFNEIYELRPIKDNHGGSLSVNLFHTFLALKKLKPKKVIESGVFKGQTTWLINTYLPETKIIGIEPFQEQIVYFGKNTNYVKFDFLNLSEKNISKESAKNTFIIFDDHQNVYPRLIHAHKLGFKNIYFDDNYPEYRGMRHLSLEAIKNDKADSGFEIPKDSKKNVENILKNYYIFPPIFPYEKEITMEKSFIKQTPVFQKYDGSKDLEKFNNDMHNYRWSTLVELI